MIRVPGWTRQALDRADSLTKGDAMHLPCVEQRVTPRQLALVRTVRDLLGMQPIHARRLLASLRLRPETTAALERGLQQPARLRDWADLTILRHERQEERDRHQQERVLASPQWRARR